MLMSNAFEKSIVPTTPEHNVRFGCLHPSFAAPK